MTLVALSHFVAKQQDFAGELHTCYEAGASKTKACAEFRCSQRIVDETTAR